MNKLVAVVIAIIVVTAVVIGVVSYYSLTQKSKELPTSTEHVGGKYNVILSFFNSSGVDQMEYTDETGSHSGFTIFEPEMRTGLDWIKNATPENAVFLCWWDYGHMIKGYAERNVVARNPSHEWINMIAEPARSQVTEFDPNEKIVDVAKALTTNNSTETLLIMEKYGATYVVVYKDRYTNGTNSWIFEVAGFEHDTYFEFTEDSGWVLNEAGRQTMIARFLDNRDTGLTLAYQDAVMKVYRKD